MSARSASAENDVSKEKLMQDMRAVVTDAEELLRAREEALSHMRRAGVVVLDVPPERAAEAVVDKYLELKRRGRL